MQMMAGTYMYACSSRLLEWKYARNKARQQLLLSSRRAARSCVTCISAWLCFQISITLETRGQLSCGGFVSFRIAPLEGSRRAWSFLSFEFSFPAHYH